jgi:hypothetical protein
MTRPGTFLVGLLVMIIGASIAVDLLFDAGMPVLKGSLAVLLVVLGVRLVTHASWTPRGTNVHQTTAGEQTFRLSGRLDDNPEYDVVLGKAVVDLTGVSPPDHDVTVTVEALFGAAEVRVDPAVPYDVEGSAAFGEVRTPDQAHTALGRVRYRPPGLLPETPRLHLKVNAAFGSLVVVEAPPGAAAVT